MCVAGKGDSIRSRGDSARYHHQEKAGIFGDFVRAPECGQKKRAGTCVPAQPFRLSPPETVDAMNATLMSPWKGLNWRRRASILCRRFCAQNAQKEAGTGGPGLQWFAGGTPVGCRRLSNEERAERGRASCGERGCKYV